MLAKTDLITSTEDSLIIVYYQSVTIVNLDYYIHCCGRSEFYAKWFTMEGPDITCPNASLTPNSADMVALMSSSQWSLSLLIVCSLLTGASVLIYIETIMFIMLRLPYGTRRGFLIFLLGCFPVYSLTSMLSIYFPRSNQIAGFGASVYLSVCVYTFLLLIVNYFGGYENMVKVLHGEKFSLAKVPCCCCRCLPDVPLTMRTYHRVRLMVMQMTLVRPTALFIASILWADGITGTCFITYQTISVILNGVATISTLCAIYGLSLFYDMSLRPLRKFYVRPKFFGMKGLLLLTNVQRLLFAVLTRFDVIGCLSPLPCDREFTGNVLYNIVLVLEMPVLLICGRVVVARWVSKTQQHKPSETDDSGSEVSSNMSKLGKHNGINGGMNGHAHALHSADEVSINSANSARSAPATTMNTTGVEPAVMPGLRVITSQTSTTSLV